MSINRRAAKRDANEPAIVSALEALGCVVWRVSGKGLPDLIVLRAGKKWLADVKMPGKPTTEAQEELWEEAATKARCAVFILRTPEDAQKMLNNALQPWEPNPLRASLSRRCGKNGCRRLRPCATHDDTETQRRLMTGYTPPRQLVDGRPHFNGLVPKETLAAAKEAEATFAPAEPRRSKVCLDPDKMNGAGDQFPGSDYD